MLILFAFGGLREQQIRQVDAGDQQHQTDHAHQHAAGQGKLSPLIDSQRRLVQWIEFDGTALVVTRIFFSRLAAIVFIAAFASATLTCGFNRPTIESQRKRRLFSQALSCPVST